MPRFASSIVGAHLFSSSPQAAAKFYREVFRAAGGTVEWPLVDVGMSFSSPVTIDATPVVAAGNSTASSSSSARWLPKVALDNRPVGCAEVLSLSVDSRLGFVAVSSQEGAIRRASASAHCAPFSAQPRTMGVVNWFDIATDDHKESAVAGNCRKLLRWRMTKPIAFGTSSLYITCLLAHGGVHNGDKVCGILPYGMLVPNFGRPFSLPFFCIPNREQLKPAREAAVALGGRVIHEELVADGSVSIVLDSELTPFALYHRTDEWEAVKESTVLDTTVNVV